jgi:hypothetical protein
MPIPIVSLASTPIIVFTMSHPQRISASPPITFSIIPFAVLMRPLSPVETIYMTPEIMRRASPTITIIPIPQVMIP